MSAIRHIRKTVFRLNQAEFAVVAGVTQATISRWEKGGSPTLEEMQRIRDAAAKRKIKWSDKLFFEAPKANERASA
ncbi:helix-turn-helix domain-containing protein [Aminobacter sp. MDW-2]|uniref:helix-turn-helix domain-containing protein n=1 Tax=Aminobacter sp. MDW-2 TaxID=2666139 RepID=UPI0012B121AB|nr:helix-turn-helix domain-containing protein [Aminobacter sp. MDW-2]QNH32364.1 helix-turn-helix domain-containing protein [Aminobacter sp. MDW-2]